MCTSNGSLYSHIERAWNDNLSLTGNIIRWSGRRGGVKKHFTHSPLITAETPRFVWYVCVFFLTCWKRRGQIKFYQSAQTSRNVLPAQYRPRVILARLREFGIGKLVPSIKDQSIGMKTRLINKRLIKQRLHLICRVNVTYIAFIFFLLLHVYIVHTYM